MKAWAVVPGTSEVRLVDRPEPRVTKPDDVKLRVVRVGVCGTDREEAAGGRALAPAGSKDLVIGHEMLGQVVAAGPAVSTVRPGDYAVFTVRRGCGMCEPCAMNRSDMCRTGQYRERGIWGLDGYQAEFVVDEERYLVRVPAGLADVAVLTEPLSVAEKAIDEAVRVQVARLPDAGDAGSWLAGRRCLVAGLGPIGLLAAMILRLRGAEVLGLDVVPEDSPRPRWLSAVGGRYVNGRDVALRQIPEGGQIHVLVEAAGIATLEFALVEVLAPDAVYVLTGLPGDDRQLCLSAAELVRHLVLGNQAVIGSVNASRGHFALAVEDLERARARWGGLAGQLITDRHPVAGAAEALRRHTPDEIKTVVEWSA